ncbi:MAG: amidohydrolase family protein [Desulfarculaceae bacterium]|nr:amidohydrolase family protein [Desulfarculaceae bacterium]MCF8073228.1 amidohydrolase family protein [Desulfarculaceae bacterium]MCF8100824.1 amidohydrolase family protein [Desulfarculaceae bacterium]MCF8117738.1 amidohydrolase family protein [Desulfarculaceae bacterium]
MVIDFHHHLFNREWLPEQFWNGLVERAANLRRQAGQEADPKAIAAKMFEVMADPQGDRLVEQMDRAGIAYTMLMPLDLGLELGECPVSVEEKNRCFAEITQRHQGRLGSFFGVDPRRENGVELFDKAVTQWGMRGLKLDPAAGFYPNERMVYPYYEKAVELGVPVLCHTGAAIPPFRNKYTDPIHLDDVTLDFPELTVIAAHAAFGWWQQLAFLIGKKTNLVADISGWQPLAMRDYGLFCRYLRDILSIAGTNNLLFASDGPAFNLYDMDNQWWVNLFKSLPEKAPKGIEFTPQEIEAVMQGNAQRILGPIQAK